MATRQQRVLKRRRVVAVAAPLAPRTHKRSPPSPPPLPPWGVCCGGGGGRNVHGEEEEPWLGCLRPLLRARGQRRSTLSPPILRAPRRSRRPMRVRLLATTAAGKPVFCLPSPEREDEVAGLAAAGAALAEYAAGPAGGALRSVTFPPHTLSFTAHGGLRFLASSAVGEPAAALAAYSAAAHAAAVALLTSRVHAALAKDPRYDAGRLLGGAGPALAAAVGCDPDRVPTAVAGAFVPLAMAAAVRTRAMAALNEAVRAAGCVAGMVLMVGDEEGDEGGSGGDPSCSSSPQPPRVLALAGSSPWHPVDVATVAAIVSATAPGDGREACSPLALPVARPASFLHAYVARVEMMEEEEGKVVAGGDDDAACPSSTSSSSPSSSSLLTIVLLAESASSFDAMRHAGRGCGARLRREGVAAAASAAAADPVALAHLPADSALTPLLHFAARSSARGQLVTSRLAPGAAGPPPGGLARARAALVGGGTRLGVDAATAGRRGAAQGQGGQGGQGDDATPTATATSLRPPARCYWEQPQPGRAPDGRPGVGREN